jgi:hypothetical protein
MVKCSKASCSREATGGKKQCVQCRATASQASARLRAKKQLRITADDVDAAPPPLLAPLPVNRKRALLPSAPDPAGISAPAQENQTGDPAQKKTKVRDYHYMFSPYSLGYHNI